MPTLDWIGKQAVVDHHQRVPFRLLREVSDLSVGDPEQENLLIQGDNLLALKALLPYYAGQVKCIYIDPPYNTGNEGWAYNDNVNSPEIRRWLHATVGKEAEDLSRHDKWLCMMYPRLVLLHQLLAEDGSFWMSIDDNEVHHARALLDEVFGANNFITSISWHKRVSPANDATFFSGDHDHILVYAKNKDKWQVNRLPKSGAQLQYYNNPDNDSRGLWNSSAYTCAKSADERPNLYYPIVNPNTGEEVWPNRDRVWAYDSESHAKNVDQNLLYWGVEGTAKKPRLKRFLEDSDPVVPRSIWKASEVGHNQEAKLEIRTLLGRDFFATPKPARLLQRIIHIATDPGDIVLDSFAGSGTTGHAVLHQNNEDAGNRRFILVEMEDEVARPVTAERLKRAIEGYDYEGTERTELFNHKLGIRELKKADKLLAETDRLKKEHADDYDGFERRLEDGLLILRGKKKITGRKEGLGGGFRFFELGEEVFDATGRVRDDVRFEDLARHVFFAQTGQPLPRDAQMDSPLLGATGGTAVYLLYNGVLKDTDPNGGNVLTRRLLDALPPHDGPKAIYGTACLLSKAQLQQRHITFRQLPYGVRTN